MIFFEICFLCSLFFIRFFRTKTRSETMITSKPNTTLETSSKHQGQRTNNKNKEQYQTPKRNASSRNKTEIKDTANNQNTFNVVLCFYSVCSIFVVTECVFRFEFLVLALMVWCFVSGVVNLLLFLFFVPYSCSWVFI